MSVTANSQNYDLKIISALTLESFCATFCERDEEDSTNQEGGGWGTNW